MRCSSRAARSPGQPGRSPRGRTSATAPAAMDMPSSSLVAGTGDPIWLERARAFAMTAIAQCREARAELGRGRFSLWTGDVGLAIYLWDCITAQPHFPTVDVF